MTKRRRWILLPLAALAAALIVLIIVFDWNWLKGPLEDSVSTALERQFEVAELDVDLSTAPTITLDRVRIANAEWGSRADMLTIRQVRFAIELWPLLKGQIRLPFVQVQEPDLLLETNQEGLVNWKLGEQDQPEAPPVIPNIRDLKIADAAIRYHEPRRPQDLVAVLETVDGRATDSGVQLSADGTLSDEPLSLRIASAPVDRLEAEANRFPFEFDARLGSTRLAATGSGEQLLQGQGLSVEIVVESENPGKLLPLAGREPRELGTLALTVALTRQDQIWALQQLDLQLGESDLSGDLSLSAQGEEPAIAADLHSNQVRLADVQNVIELFAGGAGKGSEEPTVEAALADAEAALEAKEVKASADPGLGLSRAMLPSVDAEVNYTIDGLSGPELALSNVDFYGRLKDRLPHITLSGEGRYQGEPVTLDVQAGGTAKGGADSYTIDANLAAAGTKAKIEGALTEPADLSGLQVRFDVTSRNLDRLLALGDVGAPQIPPFEVHGQLAQDGSSWQLTDFAGRLGASDLRGRATVELGQPEPLITADLASDQVRVADLRPLLPAESSPAAATDPEAAVDTALARAKVALEGGEKDRNGETGLGLHRDMLPGVDAEVRYTIGSLAGPELSLTNLDLHARLKDRLPRLELSGGGEYQGTPVALDVQLGRAAQGASASGDYPVQARIEAARTEIQVEGEIGKPDTLDGLDLEVQVESEDINAALAPADVTLPEIPPFVISGHIIQNGQVWRVAELYVQFSESELAGAVEVDLSDQRPFITADLQSSRLLASDLMVAGDKAEAIEERIDEAPSSAEPESNGQAVISAEGVNFEALPEIDADVAFRGEFVDLQEFRFDRLSVDLKLRDEIAVLDASGEGQYRDGPLSFEAHAGAEKSLENPDTPYPIDVSLETDRTEVRVEGTVAKPGVLAGMQVDVALSGPNLDRLGQILQLSLPTTPPFDLQSHLTHDENRWSLTGLEGTIGDSDIQGTATVVLGGERPTLEAELTSQMLDFDDLGLLVGAPTDADPGETLSVEQERAAAEAAATQGVLPDEPFDVPELRAMDARVSFRAQQVQAPRLPLEGVILDLTLEDGVLRLEPLRFDLADGRLVSNIRLDGRSDILAGDLDLEVRKVRLNRLLAGFDIDLADIEMEREGVGTFRGRAQLEVSGTSIHGLAGSANGKVAIIMDGGQINALIVEGVGLDVGEAIGLLFTGDEEEQSEMVPIQCFVGRFDVEDGIMQTEALVLETSDSTITGKGQIDLGEEILALELLAHPKDASALSASTPVRLEGTFENPQIGLVSEELQEKSLAALALGVVLPVIGAIIPFFEEGETEDTNCARLIAEASAAVSATGSSD